MAAFIRLDMFPATVTVTDSKDGARFEPARAIVTDDAVHVYMDAAGGPKEVYMQRLSDFQGRRTLGYTAIADDGSTVQITRASGCGCGSALRGFRPFAGVPQVANP